MKKVWALTIDGQITQCSAPPEKRGQGRCRHIAHQEPGEQPKDALLRFEEISKSLSNDVHKNYSDFIPKEGGKIKIKRYKISEQDKEELELISNRYQLDLALEGGYIELNEPLWSDADKNEFGEMTGLSNSQITDILHGEKFLVLERGDSSYMEGRALSPDVVEKGLPDNTVVGTGVKAMNKYAETYNFEPTKDIYVLPMYLRLGSTDYNGDPIDSNITASYKYLLRNSKNPDKQQIAYEALLNNHGLDENYARYTNGFKNPSLANEFAGKGGIFRAYLSGNSIPYSSRAVVHPNHNLEFGEIAIPAASAVDIFKPTIIKELMRKNYSEEQIVDWMDKFRGKQSEISDYDRDQLESIIKDKRVIMNRQPSLHTSSLQSFKPLISGSRKKNSDGSIHKSGERYGTGATCVVHPLYCSAYGMDFDGDAVSLYGINSDSMVEVTDRSLDANLDINTYTPRYQEKRSIMPNKESLWGLLNILEKRS